MKVRSYRELMAEQAKSAVRISGAHHSSWNGRLQAMDRKSKTGGVAGWDHTIQYNPRVVDEPLQEMFRNARAHNQDPATLRSYREAMKVVLHENIHLLAPEGHDHGQAQHAFRKPGVRALEESVTELYSQQRLNDYIDDLGLDQVAPGIKVARSKPVYRPFLPAAEAFADTIGSRSEIGSDEVIQRLAVEPADQKFRAAAEIIFDSSDLPGLVPSDQRAASVDRIGEAMRPVFAEIDELDENEPDRPRRRIGGESARVGYREVDALRKQWAQPAPQFLQDRGPQVLRALETDLVQQSQQSRKPGPGRQSQASPSNGQPSVPAPPSPTGTQQTRTQQSAGAQPVGQRQPGAQQPSGAQQPASSQGDLDQAMRAGLSGTAAMSSTRPLAAGEQGARRGGAQARQERQGPERES